MSDAEETVRGEVVQEPGQAGAQPPGEIGHDRSLDSGTSC